MNKIRSVDLQKLGSFEGPSIFKKIDPRLRAKLLNFPEILERLEGCLEFCFQMGKETDKKLDKDRFRKDLGDLIPAYTEVAKRLGILHEQSNVSAVNVTKLSSVKRNRK